MIEYQAETWCLLVTHSSSHVRLDTVANTIAHFWALELIIIKNIDQCNKINCVHSHNSITVESSCQHSAVSYTCILAELIYRFRILKIDLKTERDASTLSNLLGLSRLT
jgi:hypothetical protein